MADPNAAINGVRVHAYAIWNTMQQYLLRELLQNPNPDWPGILNSCQVIARQLSDLADEIDPVLQFFTFQPTNPTATPEELPLLLSTLAPPEAEGGGPAASMPPAAAVQAPGTTSPEDMVRDYNDLLHEMSTAYSAARRSKSSK
ncbi:unnamed protein product [Chrysoparadoxa australica]